MPYENGQENMLEFIYIYRNKLNALFGDDPEFNIYEIGEPLPDGTIERRKDGRTLNIVSSNMAKLTIARDYLGNVYEDGEKLYIDYYYGRTNDNTTGFVNIEDRPTMNEKLATQLDIAMLFEGNPHFSEFYSGVGQMGPWYCVAFKPELIQYHNDDGASLYGYRSCAMEEIAKEVFTKAENENIRFSTEMLKDNKDNKVVISGTTTSGTINRVSSNNWANGITITSI